MIASGMNFVRIFNKIFKIERLTMSLVKKALFFCFFLGSAFQISHGMHFYDDRDILYLMTQGLDYDEAKKIVEKQDKIKTIFRLKKIFQISLEKAIKKFKNMSESDINELLQSQKSFDENCDF